MAVTQYIGSRYVPLFADPLDWDITKQYEPLTIVYYQGNSFTSKQSVPANIDITNTDYWAITGNYNAQIENYRREVAAFDGRITANAQAIADEVTARMAEDTAIRGIIDDLQDSLDDEVSARESADTQIRVDFAAADAQVRTDFAAADTALSNRISTLENPSRFIACIGDSFGNESSEWPTLTANKTGYQLINRCTNEAGFTYNGTDGKTFIGQLQDIKNNANFGNVEQIIVYGGVNDFTMQASVSQMENAISTFMSEFYSIGTRRPKLIFAFGNFGNGRVRGRATEFPDWYNQIVSWCEVNGIPVVNYVPSWLACSDTQLIGSDNLHPNSAGENVIASYVERLMYGTYNGVHRTIAKTYTGNLMTTGGEDVPNTNHSVKQVLSVDNNMASFKLKGINYTNVLNNSALQGQTWYSFGLPYLDNRYWTSFGVNANEMIIGSNFQNNGEGSLAFHADPSTGKQTGLGLASTTVFNFGVGVAYWRCFGSLNVAKETFSSWNTPNNAEYHYQMY